MSYKDQVVLITGGASGIGKASVIEFAKEGAKVVFADIQKEKGTKLKDNLIEKKYHVDFYHLDISELNSVDSLLKRQSMSSSTRMVLSLRFDIAVMNCVSSIDTPRVMIEMFIS